VTVASASRIRRWVGRAFGLVLDSAFALPGLEPGRRIGGGPVTRLELVSDRELGARAIAGRGERISEKREPDGRVGCTIDASRFGYLFEARGLGRCLASPGGETILCAPAPGAGWLWERYLSGQVLPFASILRGHEVFHASAVLVDGFAFAFMGESGAGKSTLALNLHRYGARLLTDDVLALSPSNDGVIAHPGLATVKVRRPAQDLIAAHPLVRLGRVVGEDQEVRVLAIEPSVDAAPLGGVYFLRRSRVRGAFSVRTLGVSSAERLLRGTFNFVVDTPERLLNQLEVCAGVAARALILEAELPARPGPEVAARLMTDVLNRRWYELQTA
jgi:hypothetical protein